MTRLALLLLLCFCGCVRVPVVPPGPGPEPTPEVQPVVGPLRVVIWRETDLARVPEGQLQQLFGPDLHGWLKSHGVGYRIWDQHVEVAPTEGPEWRAAAGIRPKQVPWIVGTNGAKTVEGPLPATAAETIRLLEPLLP